MSVLLPQPLGPVTGDELAARDLERDTVHGMHGALTAPIMAGDVAQRDQACHIR
jgi:hypothetical protein